MRRNDSLISIILTHLCGFLVYDDNRPAVDNDDDDDEDAVTVRPGGD